MCSLEPLGDLLLDVEWQPFALFAPEPHEGWYRNQFVVVSADKVSLTLRESALAGLMLQPIIQGDVIVPRLDRILITHELPSYLLMPNVGFTCKGGLARGVRKQAA
jgi:hypothetical protein